MIMKLLKQILCATLLLSFCQSSFGQNQNVTLCVEMTNEMVSQNGVHVVGNFNGWNPATTELLDPDGDEIYSVTIQAASNEQLLYRFINGNDFASAEIVPTACAVGDGYGGFVRSLTVESEDIECFTACFGSCTECPSDPCDEAIFCDDFEPYDNTMPLGPQSLFWTTWSGAEGGEEDGIISTEQANNGLQSLYIQGADPDGGPQDVVLLLGDSTSGRYQLDFWIYIPEGSGAFYNVQHIFVPNAWELASRITFEVSGNAALETSMGEGTTFEFDHDTWFKISQIIDMDNNWTGIQVDGENIYQWPFSGQPFMINQLAAVNFYPLDDTHAFYIDDILFTQLPSTPAGDDCATAFNISNLFNQDSINYSQLFDNTNATLTGFDPIIGWECFGEPDGSGGAPELNNTLWFEFVGDGNTYFIETGMCDATNYITDGDTQIAIYSDNCTNGTPVACSEDGPNAVNGNFIAGTSIQTEEEVTYYMMIDGFDFNGTLSDGEFCIAVEPVQVMLTLCVDMASYFAINEIPEDGVFVAGTFNDFDGAATEMLDPDGDGVYTVDVEVNANSTIDYLFLNGSFDGREIVPFDCGVNIGPELGVIRRIEVGSLDIQCELVCFCECDTDCDPLIFHDISNIEFNNAISVYPNPAIDQFSIDYNFDEALELNVKVINTLGQLIQQYDISNALKGTFTLDSKILTAGVYLIEISDGSLVKTERLFIEK